MNRFDKALFHLKTLNNAIKYYAFPVDLAARHDKLQNWIATLASGTLDEVKEVSLHGAFLADVFQTILGYRSIIQGGGKVWEIHAEQTISDGGGSADGALGFFTATETKKGKVKLQGRVVAPIELKGAKADLDRAKAGESPVDQGWRYANHTEGCRWVIVSNYREIRLYCTQKSTAYYESFLLTDLAELAAFKRFYFVLCRQNFLPSSTTAPAESRIDRLLKESEDKQQEVTDDLYREYKEIRELLVNDFIRSEQTAPHQELLLIEKAQKLLDRVLFIAFCEDQQLLPKHTLKQAYESRNVYQPQPIWENFKALFRWVDKGNEQPPIPGYNGGLFAHDELLDGQLTVPDSRCKRLKNLAKYEFDTDVSADILGRIFEQSITDLEALKAEKTGQVYDQKSGKRKTQGVYYTPAWVTQYIVATTLGSYLQQQDQEIRPAIDTTATTAQTEIEFWRTYRDRLQTLRVADPACGSGAFLIAAFDYLRQEYQRINLQLETLGATADVMNAETIDRTILTQNLYGVDLSPESIEITKLSLWLKTAVPGKPLTNLDRNIKTGNSIVADGSIAPRAFDWATEFPQVHSEGGFDVVIGNPPYVRQELLSPIKPYLQQHYAAYDGVADLYTYFYEKGITLLKPGGVLSYIVTNKWLRSGYGEPLRRFFTQNSSFEQIIDFGHAPIFQDADTFPCIVVARNSRSAAERVDPPKSPLKRGTLSSGSVPSFLRRAREDQFDGQEEAGIEAKSSVLVCPVPREKLAGINLTQYVQESGYPIAWSRFTHKAWSLERPEVDRLMEKIQSVGVPLKEFAGSKPYYGVTTGLNEAFLIDDETKNNLIQSDPKSAEIIKPYIRGRDVKRWHFEWQNVWMIFVRWDCEIERYPAVLKWLETHRESLENRPAVKRGCYPWYAMHRYGSDYWQAYEQPKITYQVIQFAPLYALDLSKAYGSDKVYIIPSADLCLLSWLNSHLLWWYKWRYLSHMKDDALNPAVPQMETLPIAPPTDEIRSQVEPIVSRLIEITRANQEGYRTVLDWVRSRFRIEKPGQKLENFAQLSREDMIDEVRTRIPKGKSKASDRLGAGGQKEVTDVYNEYALPIRIRSSEAQRLEHQLSDLINQAYGLTPEEIDLMWKTAPPRMPILKADE